MKIPRIKRYFRKFSLEIYDFNPKNSNYPKFIIIVFKVKNFSTIFCGIPRELKEKGLENIGLKEPKVYCSNFPLTVKDIISLKINSNENLYSTIEFNNFIVFDEIAEEKIKNFREKYLKRLGSEELEGIEEPFHYYQDINDRLMKKITRKKILGRNR